MFAPSSLIDVNITLGQWPTRRVACDNVAKLTEKLREQKVTEAWVGHYDGLFHADLAAVNNRLVEQCASIKDVNLVPFGEINPLAPNWERELERCATVHKMPGVRLHPNYHDYRLDNPRFLRLLQAATERKLIVQLTILMDDARMMHAHMRVPPVDTGPLEKAIEQAADLRLVLLNALTTASRTDALYRLTNAGNVYVEIAMLETMAALEAVLKDIPASRILFGSHAPTFYFEAALLKLRESALPDPHFRAITSENAQRLLSDRLG